MQYVTVAVASELEAERLKQDLTENPGTPLLTPRWGNAVHATLAGLPASTPAGPPASPAVASTGPAPATGPAPTAAVDTGPVGRSEVIDRALIREAAARATQVYPGAVGELLSRELLSWEQFGYRLGSRTSIMQIVEQILGACMAAEQPSRDARARAA